MSRYLSLDKIYIGPDIKVWTKNIDQTKQYLNERSGQKYVDKNNVQILNFRQNLYWQNKTIYG